MTLRIEPSWKEVLKEEFDREYMRKLRVFLQAEQQKYTIYPSNANLFQAFQETPFDQVKVVVLGQDPYHQPGQAHGLSFSVPQGIMIPPSLRNIYKELVSDIDGFRMPDHGNLSTWARQGVFLLNATLSVRATQAGSHQKQGWEEFTDRVIQLLSEKRSDLVFLLWGRYAKEKVKLIDSTKHLVLTSAHPSPLSAYNGFFGCKHFSKTNQYLISKGVAPIDWQIR